MPPDPEHVCLLTLVLVFFLLAYFGNLLSPSYYIHLPLISIFLFQLAIPIVSVLIAVN